MVGGAELGGDVTRPGLRTPTREKIQMTLLLIGAALVAVGATVWSLVRDVLRGGRGG